MSGENDGALFCMAHNAYLAAFKNRKVNYVTTIV